jgi:hypothetical protein
MKSSNGIFGRGRNSTREQQLIKIVPKVSLLKSLCPSYYKTIGGGCERHLYSFSVHAEKRKIPLHETLKKKNPALP